MAFNYTDMLGNMFGGMAKSLGYGDMVIQPRKPNGPPTKQLLPSEIAAGDMMHGMNAGMEDMQMPSMQATHSMLPHLLSYHAYGGPLDPRKINIVGEQGPEAVVGQQVIPLDQQIVNREQGQIMQPPVQQIVNPAPAQIPLPLGLAQTEQDDQRDNTQGTWQPGQATQQQTTQQQASPEDALRQQIMETLQGSTKRSPWADLGVSLVQAGDNWFNKKNEPIKTWAQIQADKKLAGLMPQYQIQQAASKAKEDALWNKARIENIYTDNDFQKQREADLVENRKTVAEQKKQDAINRDRNLTMRLVQRQWEHLGSYNPNDAKFAELTKKLGDVNLPLTPKDAKKQVKMEQDAETGAWFTTLTDPITGQQETRPVTTKDGKQLVTTSSSKVMSTAAGQRQDKDLDYKRWRDTTIIKPYKDAALQISQANLQLRQQESQLRASGQTDKADELARKAADATARLKATLQQRVRENKLTQDEMDDILNERGGWGETDIGIGNPQQ